MNDVRGLWGVIGVSNEMTIEPKPNASSIRDKIMVALDRSWFDPAAINVFANDGKVKLTGRSSPGASTIKRRLPRGPRRARRLLRMISPLAELPLVPANLANRVGGHSFWS